MRVLLTGATSFTGMWFAEALAARGHSIVAAVRNGDAAYSGLRMRRIDRLRKCSQLVWDAPFGGEAFLNIIETREPFDVLCHHAAETRDYKSEDFDAIAATSANVNSLRPVLHMLRDTGCRRIVLTGSVFEADEGVGSEPMRAFGGYGLSKSLTAQIFSFYSTHVGFGFGKFVIANPFGPYEEPRFTDYLLRCWKAGKAARVNTPRYVRDNVHVSLLARAYAGFVGDLPTSGMRKLNPSFYVESQGAFAARFAREISKRLKIDALLEFADQTEFLEPPVRINTELISPARFDWSEERAWDEAASYYAAEFDLKHR